MLEALTRHFVLSIGPVLLVTGLLIIFAVVGEGRLPG